ncbi:MAG TPA: aminotransferase class III-fold pyridoxal phosphate-dependent enzyme [Deltaproteobacteria bacterium]|nr:aminotransferase class III-fold pyridoxal phosphate-dependent enzyme [Candidatus Binatota bacterium]HIL12606.1 aminotransferase class III-fold pyridoxal phosphate-dependent enzyme [Deltaproteobacteria bacterium]
MSRRDPGAGESPRAGDLPARTRYPRTEGSRRLLEQAARLLPSGVRSNTGLADDALLVASARGAIVTDSDGNDYVDYLLGSGPMILGHAHPAVVEAVSRQLADGSSYLALNERAVELAQAVVDRVPCAEAVSFYSSGSESVNYALRLARAATGRQKILKFEGAFHGMGDESLHSNQWTTGLGEGQAAAGGTAARPLAVANSAGLPGAVTESVLVAPYNDLASTAELLAEQGAEVAAIIVEPMQRTLVPAEGFLAGLRQLADSSGALLIFDEMVTAFRLARGGAQEAYGVVPDLATLGKTVSGGHPLAVLCGAAEIMEYLRPGREPAAGGVMQTSTFSGNPVSCVAALATLAELDRPGVYQRLAASGQRLRAGLDAAFAAAGIEACSSGHDTAFEAWFLPRPPRNHRDTLATDRGRQTEFAHLLLERGVLKGHEKFFVCTAHDDSLLEFTVQAFHDAAAALAASRD